MNWRASDGCRRESTSTSQQDPAVPSALPPTKLQDQSAGAETKTGATGQVPGNERIEAENETDKERASEARPGRGTQGEVSPAENHLRPGREGGEVPCSVHAIAKAVN